MAATAVGLVVIFLAGSCLGKKVVRWKRKNFELIDTEIDPEAREVALERVRSILSSTDSHAEAISRYEEGEFVQ